MEYVILKNYVTQTVSQKRSMIQSQCQQLVDQISQSGYVHGNESTQVDKQMRQLANLYNGRLIVVNSNFRIIRDTFEISCPSMTPPRTSSRERVIFPNGRVRIRAT